MSNRAVVAALAAAGIAVGAPLAAGASPTVTPVPNSTQVLPAGKACPFKVIDTVLPSSRKTETVYPDGRHVIAGRAKERLRRAGSPTSIVIDTTGVVKFKEAADGTTRFRFRGSNILYFYPGDRGPFGVVGTGGALFHIRGRIGETLAKDGTVTAFAYRGRVTELCSKLA